MKTVGREVNVKGMAAPELEMTKLQMMMIITDLLNYISR